MPSSSQGRVDLHCHLLPGIDDGPPNMERTVMMARVAVEDGTSTILATTHWPLEGLEPTPERLNALADEVRVALDEAEIPLRFQPCHELMADHTLPERVEKGIAFSFGGRKRYCLVETPYHVLPPYFRDMLFNLQTRGFTPIIAHPERSAPIQGDPARLAEFIEVGCLAQVTASSVTDTGPYGRLARGFLRQGLAHLVASDGHSPRRRPPVLSEAVTVLEKEFGAPFAEAVTRSMPSALLAGEDPPELPAMVKPRGLLSRLFGR
jgi:protein-tyrosine phosphatase